MKNETIDGIGSFHGGEIDTFSVNGIGKLKRKTKANQVFVNGLLKSKALLSTSEIHIEGVARIFRDVKAKNVFINGVLKLRRAVLKAENITCDGLIISNKEISADDIFINGVCSVKKMYGDHITIQFNKNSLKEHKVPTKLSFPIKLYFGREVSLSHSLVDILECTSLKANNLKVKILRAGSVDLSDNCSIGKLYCDGGIQFDETCEIGEIISKNESINIERKKPNMANQSFIRILELYKNGNINADEAEKMLSSFSAKPENNATPDVSWGDDGKLRIVAFIGRKLLHKGDTNAKCVEVTYHGEALNVDCDFSIICQNIGQSANAGGSINATSIGGNASCGGSISCGNVNGNISAGGSVSMIK